MAPTDEVDVNRIPKLAVTGVLFLLLLIAGLGLKPGGSLTILEDSLQMSGHFGVFGILAFCAALAAPYLLPWSKDRRWAQYLCGLVVSIGVGALLEVGQLFIPGRYANLSDLTLDVAGAIAAICLLIAIHQIGRQGIQWRVLQIASGIAFFLLVILGTQPFVLCYIDYQKRNAALPNLIDLNEGWSRRFAYIGEGAGQLIGQLPNGWTGGEDVVGVRFPKGTRYPGLGIKEPYPDWRAFKTFAFDVFAPIPGPLEFRVNDVEHNNEFDDRFNRRLNLEQGFRTIRIPIDQIRTGPKNRELDLSKIDRIQLFVYKPSADFDLWLGNFRLE